jgi:hypothetical protein
MIRLSWLSPWLVGLSACFASLLGPASLAWSPIEGYLQEHCMACHRGDDPEASLDLSDLPVDLEDPGNFSAWARVHDRVAAGEMPPATEARPAKEATAKMLGLLEDRLHQVDLRRSGDLGRLRLRRMTRSEFENSLQDLLGLPRLDIQSMLPSDGSVRGFTKIAQGLDVSPTHLMAYAAAAEAAVTAAIATRSTPPPVFRQRIYPAGLFKFSANLKHGNFVLLKDQAPDPQLPLRAGYEEVKGYIADTNANADMAERDRIFRDHQIAASQSSVGLLNPNLAGYEAAWNVAPIYAGYYRLRLSLWGFQWNQGKVEPIDLPQAAVLRAHEEGKQQEGGRLLGMFTAHSLEPRVYEIITWLDPHESLVFDPVSIPWLGLQVRQVGGRTARHIGPGVALDWFEVEGPLNESWPPDSHRRLFGDLPIVPRSAEATDLAPRRDPIRQAPLYRPAFPQDLPTAEKQPPLESVATRQPTADSRRLLEAFLGRAFRRPIRPLEVEPYAQLVQERLAAQDCFEDAMRRAYIAILTSPEFLFHDGSVEQGSEMVEAKATRDQAFRLASRLSYWLWNGPPDEELLTAAKDGSLLQIRQLSQQVERLLSDRKSDRFLEDFAHQWLQLDRIDETTPDKQLYPEYSFLLRQSMVAETLAFLRELIDEDLPVSRLVDSDFLMINQRLAEHYGIEHVPGVEIRRVPVPAGNPRGGLMTQAALLKVTANGTTTSPVRRGLWVMDRLLDDPARPPPPNVSLIDPDTRGATTIREQLDRHRRDSQCAACHAKIDPAGFAMESFDPIGGFRQRYRSTGQGLLPPEHGKTLWRVRYRLGPPVDSTGQLADGRSFDGVQPLKQLLADNPERLARAFIAHLIRYATGAEISFADRRAINAIVEATAGSQYGLRSLIHTLAIHPLITESPIVVD